MTQNDDQLSAHLEALENDLLAEPTRTSRAALEGLLAKDFVEFGCSGRVFDRERVIAALLEGGDDAVHSTSEFKLTRLADDAALVTYRIKSTSPNGEPKRESLRSSLWVRAGGSWAMRFHQGTRSQS